MLIRFFSPLFKVYSYVCPLSLWNTGCYPLVCLCYRCFWTSGLSVVCCGAMTGWASLSCTRRYCLPTTFIVTLIFNIISTFFLWNRTIDMYHTVVYDYFRIEWINFTLIRKAASKINILVLLEIYFQYLFFWQRHYGNCDISPNANTHYLRLSDNEENYYNYSL